MHRCCWAGVVGVSVLRHEADVSLYSIAKLHQSMKIRLVHTPCIIVASTMGLHKGIKISALGEVGGEVGGEGGRPAGGQLAAPVPVEVLVPRCFQYLLPLGNDGISNRSGRTDAVHPCLGTILLHQHILRRHFFHYGSCCISAQITVDTRHYDFPHN